MTIRVKHDGCRRAGWIEHGTDWLGRTVESCTGCDHKAPLTLTRPVANVVAVQRGAMRPPARKSPETVARLQAEFDAVRAVLPEDEADAIPLKEIARLTTLTEGVTRVALRNLWDAEVLSWGWAEIAIRGKRARTLKVYWLAGPDGPVQGENRRAGVFSDED